MTAPNLTPAEALEVVKIMLSPSKEFAAKKDCIAALETLLSEHEATKAKLAAYEAKPLTARAAWEKAWSEEPAAAVPSDEEIAKAIRKADSTRTPYAVGHLTEAVEMLAKRIGVKL